MRASLVEPCILWQSKGPPTFFRKLCCLWSGRYKVFVPDTFPQKYITKGFVRKLIYIELLGRKKKI